jgi:DNA-binding CsgD family transcriptional regulator
MRLFALLGQRHRALRQYRQLEGALRRDLDAAPDPTTTRLFEAIARGDLAASPAAASRQRAPAWAVRALSHREQQVAALIARGLTNREIARTLGLSPRTADTHVGHILHKVGARSRAELADMAAGGHLSCWPA